MITEIRTTNSAPWDSLQVMTAIGISYLGMAATFLSNVVLARVLGAEGKGSFSLFQVMVTAIVTFSALGIGHGQMFHAAKDPRQLRHFMPNAYLISGLLGGGMAAVWVALAALLNRNPLGKLGWLAGAALVVIVPIISLSVFQRQYFLTRHNYRLSKCIVALSQILPLAGYVSLFALGHATLINAIIMFVAAQVLCCVIAELLIERNGSWLKNISFAFARLSAVFGIQQYLSGVVEFLMARLDFFLVGLFLGRKGLGLYSVAVAMAEITIRLPNELGTVLFPAFASGSLETSRAATILRKLLLLSLVIAALLAMSSGSIIVLLFGKQFRDAVPAFRWLLLGTIAWSTIYVTWNRTSARG